MGKSRRRIEHEEETEKTLRNKIKAQDAEIKRLKLALKKYEAGEPKIKEKKVEIKLENSCPDCAGEVKTTTLPFGKMEICIAGCGWRKVKHET